jgi:hypothetical protein
MRRVLLLGLAMLLLSSQAGFSTEQTVEAIVPQGEQEIEPITPPGDQVVEAVGAGGDQRVERQEPRTAAEKTASTVGKVVTGVTAAAVSLGAMAAMLIFL